jgi:hypothetical protein
MNVKDFEVCDDCLLVAYDKGIGRVKEYLYEDLDEFEVAESKGYQQQAYAMAMGGDVFEDHDCTSKMEPELNMRCDCACYVTF